MLDKVFPFSIAMEYASKIIQDLSIDTKGEIGEFLEGG